MRLILSVLTIIVVGALVLTACNSAGQKSKSAAPVAGTSPLPSPTDGARRITKTELQELLAKNEAVVIDVRNEASYNAGHIRGARLIPEADILKHISELPKNKLIVTYCS